MVYFFNLAIKDLKNIARDKFLVYATLFLPVFVVVLSRLVLPWISDEYYNLEPYYPIFFMMMAIMMPMIFGFITAFLIMDERDENLLTVLRVMPISRNKYIMYRMFFMVIFSFIYVLIFPYLSGLVEISMVEYVPVAVLFAFFTPFISLFVNVFATNKVQAFAIFKILGSVFFLPLFAFFIENDLKYVFGVIPNFWTYMSLNSVIISGVNDYLYLIIGFIYHIVLIIVLLNVFNKKY